MDKEEAEELKCKISSIENKLEIVHNIDKSVALIQQQLNTIEKGVEENKANNETLRQRHENLKLKVYVISASISTAVSIISFLISRFF